MASIPRGDTTRRIFEALCGEPLPDWPVACRALTVVRLSAGERLFRAGEVDPCVYSVCHGLLKLVYETPDGEEWIKSFTQQGEFFASISALQPGGRTTFAALAIEATELERIDYASLLRLAEAHVPWQRVVRHGLELFGTRKEERERALLTLSARERYLAFIAENPALTERIPQKDMARYLGITPVGLSRMRRRIAAPA